MRWSFIRGMDQYCPTFIRARKVLQFSSLQKVGNVSINAHQLLLLKSSSAIIYLITMCLLVMTKIGNYCKARGEFHFSTWIDSHLISKGQLISKCHVFLVSSILPKNEHKKINFTTMVPQVELFSFIFWHQKDILTLSDL